ncbi:MAG: RHS repeat protein [Mariprofundus sp.]|nr:RHS repeat protein [Mariprofundus sp.]
MSNPSGDVATSSYNGLSVTTTNAKGQFTITSKNSQGKVIRVLNTDKKQMTYAYDAFGNLTQTTDAVGNVTSMRYDIRGRKVGMTDPDMGTWTYAYDALGNLTSQTDAKYQTTTMLYDKLGRMTSRTEAEGISSWTYDTVWIGALSSETGGISSKSYVYDTFGRVRASIRRSTTSSTASAQLTTTLAGLIPSPTRPV